MKTDNKKHCYVLLTGIHGAPMAHQLGFGFQQAPCGGAYLSLEKKKAPRRVLIRLLSSLAIKAFTAINRTIILWLKRNFAIVSASCANCTIHLSVSAVRSATGAVFASNTARFASLWLICKSFFSEKLLFRNGKNKFCATVFACDSFVIVH